MRRTLVALVTGVVLLATTLAAPAVADAPAPARVEGLITDADGAPLEGAQISCECRGAKITTTTDHEGRYVLETQDLAAGSYETLRYDPGRAYLRRAKTSMTLKPGTTYQVDHVLGAAGGLRLRLVDPTGRPIVGSVSIHTSQNTVSATTDDLGRVEDTTLAPTAELKVFLRAVYKVPRQLTSTVEVGRTTDLGDVVLVAPVRLRYTVRDAAGSPVPGMRVGVFGKDREGMSFDNGAITDEAGRTPFLWAAPDSAARVRVADPSGFRVVVEREITTPSAGEEVEDVAVLAPAGHVAVQVLDDRGRPVQDALVQPTDPGRRTDGTVRWTDQDGRAVLTGVGLDVTSLTVAQGRHVTTTAKIVPVHGESLAVTVRSARAALVFGTVRTIDGSPLRHPKIVLQRDVGDRWTSLDAAWLERHGGSASPDPASPTYELGPLPFGLYRLVVTDLTRRVGYSPAFYANPDELLTVDLVLPREPVRVVRKPRMPSSVTVGKRLRITPGRYAVKGTTVEYRWYLAGRRIPSPIGGWKATKASRGRTVTVEAVVRARGYTTRVHQVGRTVVRR